MTLSPTRALMPFIVLVVAAACSAPAPEVSQDGAPAPTTETGARTLSIPVDDQPGHTGGGPNTLHWDAPAGWIEEQPRSNMRFAQYRVPGADGDAECVVYYFGPGQGGDPAANARRWAGQFQQPDGRDSIEVMRVVDLDGARVRVQVVEVTGTYDGGMTMTDAPAEQLQDAMLLGAIAEGPDAPWFFKFTGPEATVRGQREPFLQMLRSLHRGH